jgi:hypothetical protein
LANRKSLAAALSHGIRKSAIEKAKATGADPGEAVRVMDDVLSVVADMDFVGASSQKYVNKRNVSDPKNHTFCTMPIRLRFEDRNARIHFKTAIKSHCDLKAVMSLPRPIREEQAAFQRAVKQRYPDEIVTIRPDIRGASLQAFRKVAGQKGWTKCPEAIELRPGTLLPGYVPRTNFLLDPEVQVMEPDLAENSTGPGAVQQQQQQP